jgi:antitoxin HicB
MEKQNIGSDFDDFLAEDGILEMVTAAAVRRVNGWQIGKEISAQKVTQTAMTQKLKTSSASPKLY